MPNHLVLLGDSIFDNAFYVPGGPAVIDHVRRTLPRDWQATLVAVDGARTSSVFRQIERIPADATHLVLSVGGNDALWAAGNTFGLPATLVVDALQQLAEVQAEFAAEYGRLLDELCSLGKPLTTCTVYDAVPGLGKAERAGLALFNDVITKSAFTRQLSLIDLRVTCDHPNDYAAVSPIEPSAAGGRKIAQAIVDAVQAMSVRSGIYA
jgi:hypothetical protein